jgi:hypothetical protein
MSAGRRSQKSALIFLVLYSRPVDAQKVLRSYAFLALPRCRRSMVRASPSRWQHPASHMKDSAITNSLDREGSFEDSLGGCGPFWIILEKSRLF